MTTPRRWTACTLLIVSAAWFSTSPPVAGGAVADRPGEFRLLNGGAGSRVIATYANGEPGDEFGSAIGTQAVEGTISGAYLVGAPGAQGGTGRLLLIDWVAQTIVEQIDAAAVAPSLGRFGQSLTQIGHIDNDISVHWVVGAPGDPGDPAAAAAAVVLSRSNGRYALRDLVRGSPGSLFGWRVAFVDDDVANAFFLRFAVSAPRAARGKKLAAGVVQAFDSETARPRWTRRGSRRDELFGYSMTTALDVDGDGFDELVVGAPGTSDRKPAGRVYVLSGRTGKILRRVDAPPDAVWFGFAAQLRDFDRNGSHELFVGAPLTSPDGIDEAGSVYVFAEDGRLLRRIDGAGAGEWLGIWINVTDVGMDGTWELQAAHRGRSRRAPKDDRGALSTFSLVTGEALSSLRGRRGGDYFGSRGVVLSRDVNGDGVVDRTVGVPRRPIPFLPE